MRQDRRDFISKRLNVRKVALLEIGAMDSPTFPERNCRYLDWFSREELQGSIAKNPNRLPERVVVPHYVVKQKAFADMVPDRFDAVIANHVFEHIGDPIRWLGQVGRLVNDGGSLFLSLPDRRYTFDYLRPVSTVADMVRAYAEDLQRPSRWQMLEAIFYQRPIRAPDVWDGDVSDKLKRARFTLDAAMEASSKAERQYVDVHCHVFTFATFASLIEDLAGGGYIDWKVRDAQDVAQGSNEFYVHLVHEPTPST